MQDSDHRYKPTRSKTGERFPSLGEDGRWREDERAGKVSKEIFEIHCARISRWFELPSGPQPTWGGRRYSIGYAAAVLPSIFARGEIIARGRSVE